MVDIVVVTDSVLKMDIVVNGCNDILPGHMLGNQLMDILPNGLRKPFRILPEFLKNLRQNRIIHMLCNAKLSGIAINEAGKLHHHIGKNFYISLLCLNIYIRNGRILNFIGQLCTHLCPCFRKHLSCQGIHHILRKNMVPYPVAERQLFVEFISSHLCQIISSGVKKHGVNKAFRTLNAEGLTGTDFFVQL